jgi:hypothetical protein
MRFGHLLEVNFRCAWISIQLQTIRDLLCPLRVLLYRRCLRHRPRCVH